MSKTMVLMNFMADVEWFLFGGWGALAVYTF